MSQNNNIRYTVISCLAIISMVIGLFVYDTVTEKELTADQYKLLKFYKLNTKRELSDFKLASGNEAFTNDNFKDQWNLIFYGLRFMSRHVSHDNESNSQDFRFIRG